MEGSAYTGKNIENIIKFTIKSIIGIIHLWHLKH